MLSFVKFQVKLINFDSMRKRSADILYFLTSQGSIATQLRWGGKSCNSYIDSLLSYLSMKEFWKSVYICRRYNQKSCVLYTGYIQCLEI